MANVDFTEQIANFRSAQRGEEVRESLIDVAEAVETACNNQLITIDSTLTESGQGADAKAVGDKVATLASAKIVNGYDVQIMLGQTTSSASVNVPMTVKFDEQIDELRSAIDDISGATSVDISVSGTSLVINTNVVNGNEVSF